MGAIASRSLHTPRTTHGWAAWMLLAIPFFGIGGLLYASSHKVVKPTMSIFQAVDSRDLDAIRAHARTGTDLNELDPSGHTALYEALANEDEKSATLLLQCGANPNASQKDLETPLMLASGQGNSEMVRELLKSGAHPNEGPGNGLDALCEGASSGNAVVVSYLLKAGADPNASLGSTGATPLNIAAWRGDLRSVNLLLSAGARPNARGFEGRTPLDQATSRHHEDVVERLKKALVKY